MTSAGPDDAAPRARPHVTLRPGSLSGRLALATALAVFVCLLLAGATVGAIVGRAVVADAEARLAQVEAAVASGVTVPSTGEDLCALANATEADRESFPAGEVLVDVVRPDGTLCTDTRERAIGPAVEPPLLARLVFGFDLPQATTADGQRVLVLDVGLDDGWMLRIARDVARDNDLLRTVQVAFLAVSATGVLLALGAGLLIARNGLRPVRALADAADHVARTQDLSVRVDVPGGLSDGGGDSRDEVHRLAGAFNRMTAALAASRDRQARLVADASHELRTPLTSLRTNVELLVRSERLGRALPGEDRDALLADLSSQVEELSRLAEELTDLARGEPERGITDVRLDAVVRRAVERARLRTDGHRIAADLMPWVVPAADADALERAVVNVLDNALKFSPPGSEVTVRLAGGTVTVDDHGPGIPPEERGLAVERFWRSADARALPGSGLGLAIAAEAVIDAHGRLEIADAPGGGTRVTLTVPGSPPPTEASGGGVRGEPR